MPPILRKAARFCLGAMSGWLVDATAMDSRRLWPGIWAKGLYSSPPGVVLLLFRGVGAGRGWPCRRRAARLGRGVTEGGRMDATGATRGREGVGLSTSGGVVSEEKA